MTQATGSGKSMIFQGLPMAFELYYNNISNPCSKSVMVISLLTALMNDQRISLSSKGLRVFCLLEDSNNIEIELLQVYLASYTFSVIS